MLVYIKNLSVTVCTQHDLFIYCTDMKCLPMGKKEHK